tara:strand:+ start:315 stop:1367 length:1053 start_codon:yes stop_codon:yes gene_type:complete
MKIGFIGLGKLGGPVSEVMAQHHDVDGYDIDGRGEIVDAVKNKDIIFIAVPTPHDERYDGRYVCSDLPPKDFYYQNVKDLLGNLDTMLHEDQIVVLISTVLPGTTRREFVPMLTKAKFVYNPYLIAMGTVKEDFKKPEMIMMGGDEDAMDVLENFYREMCNCDRYIRGTYEECESIKIFYNTFITTKITLANMIQDVAVKLGNMNVDIVTDALANSTNRIMSTKYMKAGMGDGGSCHPRDNIALRWLAQDLNLGYDIFSTIIKAREKQAHNMALEIIKHGSRIQFSSNSFKPGTDIEDGSYSILIQHYIKELGGTVVDKQPHVYVQVHPGDEPMEGVYNFDPWNNYGNNK